MANRKRLGEILIEWAIIGQKELQSALHHAVDRGIRVGEALIDLKLATESQVWKALAAQNNLEYVDLASVAIPASASQLIPIDVIRKFLVLPLGMEGNRIRAAVHDPLGLETLDILRLRLGKTIKPVLATRAQILAVVNSTFGIATISFGDVTGPALRVPNRPDASIALRGVRLQSQIRGMSQRTTIHQTFVNQEHDAVEAVYTFPLPEGAAVCGFEVVTADRVLTGQVEESENAIDQYEQAIGQGNGAFMIEQDRPDVFSVRAGNLKPGQAATVRLTYVCLLERADKSIRVAFPTALAPRYATNSGTDPLAAMVDGDALNPPHLLYAPYGLNMEVEIDMGRQLVGVQSPSHAIKVERGDARERSTGVAIHTTRVTLAAGMTEMNRDIVLHIELAREHQPCVQWERGKDGARYLAVTFVPEFDLDDVAGSEGQGPAPSETVFVLDCSGSMQGGSIRQATAALELCLRGMNEGDTFNICRFGSSFELMASEPLRYGQETLDQAIAYVRQGGDLGGTELYGPLEAVLRQPTVAGTVRQIVLLTDGQVTNEPACIDLARRNRARNRVFPFGIGPACSTHLVQGLARASGGAAEFITTGERIDEKVLRTFSRLASPFVTEVSIGWGGAEVQTLAEFPPIFDGDVLAIFGRSLGRLPAAVTLSCMTGSGPKNWRVTVPPTASRESGGVIATMWARRTIQSLEEVNNLTDSRPRPAVKSRERGMVVRLSEEFGLLSSLTTFIAVEHRTVDERNEGRPALRRVPVMLAAGWGGVGTEQMRRLTGGASALGPCHTMDKTVDRSMDCSIDRSVASPAVRKRSRGSIVRKLFGAILDDDLQAPLSEEAALGKARSFSPSTSSPSPGQYMPLQDRSKHGSVKDNVLDLLSYQLADGSFGRGADVGGHARSGETARMLSKVKPRLAELGSNVPSDEPILRTVIAVLVMTSKFADDQDLWHRSRGKAIRFVARAVGKTVSEVKQWFAKMLAKLVAR